jgi:hypothetical protein
MPRASWRGDLRLSLVCYPIYLSPATVNELGRSPVRTMSCAGMSDRTASKMTQHHVRTRSDVIREARTPDDCPGQGSKQGHLDIAVNEVGSPGKA